MKTWKITLPSGYSYEQENNLSFEQLRGAFPADCQIEEVAEPVVVLPDPKPGTMLLTTEEAAKELRVSSRFVYTLSHRADFPTVILGRRRMISRAGLAEWVRKQEQNRGEVT